MNRKKDIFELISYGVLSTMFALAFFFGLMYPQYGLPIGTYCALDEASFGDEQQEDIGGNIQNENTQNENMQAGIMQDIRQYDQNHNYQNLDEKQLKEQILENPDLVRIKSIPRKKIVYQSYVWECLKTI